MLAYTGTSLLFLAPLLVSLALKVNDLVGIDAAPGRLALVTSVGSLLSMVANPFFGRLSDRTLLAVGHAQAVDAGRSRRGQPGHPDGRSRAQHHGRAPRLVHGAGVLQRLARGVGRRHARPGPYRANVAWCPGCWRSASQSRRSSARSWFSCSTRTSSPCCWCRARSAWSSCCCSSPGSPIAGWIWTGPAVVDPRVWHVLRQSAAQPGLRLGVRQPVPARHRLRLPGHLPGVLPARPGRASASTT